LFWHRQKDSLLLVSIEISSAFVPRKDSFCHSLQERVHCYHYFFIARDRNGQQEEELYGVVVAVLETSFFWSGLSNITSFQTLLRPILRIVTTPIPIRRQ